MPYVRESRSSEERLRLHRTEHGARKLAIRSYLEYFLAESTILNHVTRDSMSALGRCLVSFWMARLERGFEREKRIR